MLRSMLVIGLVTAMGVLVRAAPACACSCRELTQEEALALADVVFAGTVTDVHSSATGPIYSSADPVTVTFEVDTVQKGDVPASVQVQTVVSEISCGYEFRERSRYLVYVHVDQAGQWTTGLCNGNRVLDPWTGPRAGDPSPTGDQPQSEAGPSAGAPSESAPSDQAAAGPGDGRGPATLVDDPSRRSLLLLLAVGITAVAAGVLVVLVVLLVRRRRAATITSG